MLKMKIKKIIRDGENIIVWTEEYPDNGFNFKIDEIVDKADLNAKVQLRVDELKASLDIEAQREAKFKELI